MKQSGVRGKVLDGLIERELLVLDAARLGIKISDDELSAELRAGHVYFSLPVAAPPLRSRPMGKTSARHWTRSRSSSMQNSMK